MNRLRVYMDTSVFGEYYDEEFVEGSRRFFACIIVTAETSPMHGRRLKMSGKPKAFDCVEMKRRIQEKICEETKDLTSYELIAYFRTRVAEGPFAKPWRERFAGQSGLPKP